MAKPALFLDRDGVLNVDEGYTHIFNENLIIDGSTELIKKAKNKGYYVFIITNQSGIGRGKYTEIQFHNFMNEMLAFYNSCDAYIDDIFFAPYYKYSKLNKYREKSELRKANTGMLKLACDRYKVDIYNSVIVGDSLTDIQCGARFGITNLFLLKNEVLEARETEQLKKICNFSVIYSLTELLEDYFWKSM